jgi:hypothetical protein
MRFYRLSVQRYDERAMAGKIQRKVRHGGVVVGTEPVVERIGVVVRTGDIDAELERMFAAGPGNVVAKLEALFAR